MFTASTVQLTWHDFLERMRQPSAAEFVKAIKRWFFLCYSSLKFLLILYSISEISNV